MAKVQVDWQRVKHDATLAAVHLAVWLTALALALWLVKQGGRGDRTGAMLALFFILVKGAVAVRAGSFHELWRHTSLEDLAALIRNSLATTGILALALTLIPKLGAPPSVALIDGAITLLLLAPLHVLPRVAHELVRPLRARRGRVLVLAGRPEFVDLELRRMQVRATGDRVCGLVLEGPALVGAMLRRIPVLSRKELEAMLADRAVGGVIIVPPVRASFSRELEQVCLDAATPCHSVSSLQSLGEVVENSTAELLERPPTRMEGRSVVQCITGKRVLVTGAGGTLGSELTRQLYHLNPSALALVERSENALFRIEHELQARHPNFPIESRVLDVRNALAVNRLFATFRPQVILHAAAHKHVPMMERHPSEAFLNNVIGTRTLVDAAEAFDVQTFAFISTDKAVNPTSVMGATKRLGELYIKAMSGSPTTRFVSVRFGNVLGSSGSVLPIFIEQIKRGGPVTVTHPEMSRYFMSIPEACHLVLEAAALGGNGDVYVLDMGNPVKILDLARRVIERAGLRPDIDVPIVFSGPRPGEKLSEQLTFSKETATKTKVPGIWAVASEGVALEQLTKALEALEIRAEAGEDFVVLRLMAEIIPEYNPPKLQRKRLALDDTEPRLEAAVP